MMSRCTRATRSASATKCPKSAATKFLNKFRSFGHHYLGQHHHSSSLIKCQNFPLKVQVFYHCRCCYCIHHRRHAHYLGSKVLPRTSTGVHQRSGQGRFFTITEMLHLMMVEMTGEVKSNPSAGSCRCPSGEMYSGSFLPMHLAPALIIRIGTSLTIYF